VNITTAAVHAIQDAQQTLEKRLELQAGVIRTMHNAVQSREEKLDKILSTFQALHNVGAERNGGRGLPDNL
jgi:pyridoxine 5'-phosphate synthase PdxJ